MAWPPDEGDTIFQAMDKFIAYQDTRYHTLHTTIESHKCDHNRLCGIIEKLQGRIRVLEGRDE